MKTSDTAHANPVLRRRAWREIIAPGVRELGWELVADAVGVSRARLRALVGSRDDDRDSRDEATGPAFPLDAVPALLDPALGEGGAQLFETIVGELARLRGHALVSLPAASSDVGSDLAHLEELQRSTTSIVGRLLAALADMRIDRREASAIRPLIRDAIACLLRWDAVLERVERDGVVGVRTLRAVER